jgi:S1-C subfamily serine protease
MTEESSARDKAIPGSPGRFARVAPYATGGAIVLAVVSLLAVLIPSPPRLTQDDVDARVQEALASMTPAPAFSEVVYQAVRPSLVLIQTEGPETGANESQDGIGSGVVVNLAGDILTSLHVVDDATEIRVTFADGTRSAAEIVSDDPAIDIAVLRASTPPTEIAPAVLGDPNGVREGSEAYAMGSPFGLTSSMSAGVISGLDRTFRLEDTDTVLRGLIQIDAAVNPGISGGPLLDREGHVIGILAALLNPTGDEVFVGVGLAVPINVAGGAAGLPPY